MDNEEFEDLEWEEEDEEEGEPATPHSAALSGEAIAGPSKQGCEEGLSRAELISRFVAMGFPEEMVDKAIKGNGEEDLEALLETLLTYAAIRKSTSEHENSPTGCSLASNEDTVDDDLCDFSALEYEEFIEDFSEKDIKLLTLVEMGFPTNEASAAIERCGPNSSVCELADSIHAAQMAKESDSDFRESHISDSAEANPVQSFVYNSARDKKRKKSAVRKCKRRCFPDSKNGQQKVIANDDVSSTSILKPMVGYSVPNGRLSMKLPQEAMGPPYFYYENVVLGPRSVWKTMSSYLYKVEPEFVDLRYFCALAGTRGCIHNLPIENRFPLLPVPPGTIHEALPATKKWWPSWDQRTHLSCLGTHNRAGTKVMERIQQVLADCNDPPKAEIQQFILNECRKWNLVWVGLHKVAPLEPAEIELLMGFPKDHTRGGGINRTDRYKSLGDSFQVNTVAYHLSALKNLFPDGITVLSLFSGIGGAEVALHRLGIKLRTVVSVETSKVNRNILRSWWEQTNQTGRLIEIADIQELNPCRVTELIDKFGGFDLIVGRSPCNNLSGSNCNSRDGFEGAMPILFHDYVNILNLVKELMAKTL